MLMCSACRNKPGVARQLVTFFCFAKRKVTKEKATRRLGPFAALQATCGARLRRRSAELASLKQLRPLSADSISAPRPSLNGVGEMHSGADSGSPKREALGASLWTSSPQPLERSREAQGQTDQG